jgi:hypothetical protein
MLHLHFPQQFFGPSYFAMEEALFDTLLYRSFAGLGRTERLPDRVSIHRLGKPPSPRHLKENHELTKQFFETAEDKAIYGDWCMSASQYHLTAEIGRQGGRISWQEVFVSSEFLSLVSVCAMHCVKT